MKLRLLSLLLLSIILISCNSSSNKKDISEGIIEYKIIYPKMDENDIMLASMMPKNMNMKFKDNNTVSELKTGAGVFQTKFINQNKEKKLIHLVKMVNSKYGLILDSTEIYESYAKKVDGMRIEKTQETKEIAGYTCYRAKIIFDHPENNFDIYYTNEIKISNPNWCTPFYEIDGVLMEYQLENYNILMRLTAENVVEADVEENEFTMPDDYEEITQAEMEEKFLDF